MRYGRYKEFSNKLRRASKIMDVVDLPADAIAVVPVVGPLLLALDEIAGVASCAAAGMLDVCGCLKEGDWPGALQEMLESGAETLLVAAPGLGSVQVVYDLRQYVRDRVGFYCERRFNPKAALEAADSASYWRFAL